MALFSNEDEVEDCVQAILGFILVSILLGLFHLKLWGVGMLEDKTPLPP